MEDENPIKKTVVIYVGRFQPMHKGHYGTYQHLIKKFGKDNVFIGTSDKVENPKSPFNFNEKVKIATTMFGIPKSKIFKVKNPYKPTEILKKFDEETTAFVTVVGMKDKNRLGGKYFQPWKGEPTVGYRDGGYVYAAPSSGGGISGTETRNGLSVGSDEQKQDFFKNRAYGKFNATIFKMITDKLNEGIEIPKEVIEDWLINESSVLGGAGDVDDGPNFFVPNYDIFQRVSAKRAAKIGYEVVNMITSKEIEDYYEHPEYPNGPVKAVTPFPAGVLGTQTSTNQVDIYTSDAYTKWFTHVTRKAAMVGYQLVQGLESRKDDKQAALSSQSGDKKSQEEYENSLQEAIKLPVEIGDTILTGRFKNKKVVVKSIGKDEHGMPTINGKKVVTFRLMKEGFVTELAGTAVRCEKCNHSWDIEEDDDEKYLCHSCGWDSQQQEYDYDAFDSWAEKSGLFESIEERGGKLRPAQKLRRKAAMAGKGREIARKRKRTMMRRKPLSKLKKIAYKMAYRQVYDEFAKDLFPDTPKSQLSIQQSKVVHKNVLRKKKRVLKRARFRFLPDLRAKEAEKFGGKTNEQLAKGMTLRDIANKHSVDFDELKKEAQKGVKVEMEHTSDVNQAYDIAKDHLFEDPKYYTKLATIEEVGVGTGQSGIRMGYPSKDDLKRIEKRVKKQRSNTDSNQEYQYEPIRENINESKLLMEGGAYGHMSHPFDTDINLTFGQLKDIVNRALEGTLEFTREKTDGQALAISWRDGRLVAARNKGHLKNRGENALDIKGVSDKFQGRGGLSDAYNYAMKDLSNAIKSLSDKQRDKIFKQGACFMNLEVIYPTSVNVIPYGQALLVFHGTMEYNEEGVAIGENGEAARILAGMIKQVNKDVQDNYTIQGPPVVKLPKSTDLSKKRSKYSSQISKLQKEFGLKDTDGVADYHQAWWEQWVDKNSPSTLDNKTKMGLVKRWAFMDKGFRLDKSNISDEKTLEWAKKTDKDDQKKIGKQNLMKFEQIFLGLGAEVLEFTSSALTVNPDKAVRDMKKRIDKTIKDVKKSGDPKKIEKLKLELGRLNSIGGAKKIVPNEGIVFLYNGNTFKLTGTFASVNQILGIFF
jgi:Zn finger protein HypA/HybF involved in hydrogenase expression